METDGILRISAILAGDGTVTRESALMDERVGQEWTPRMHSPIGWDRVQFLSGDHLGITNNPTFVDNVLYMLLEEPDVTDAVALPGEM